MARFSVSMRTMGLLAVVACLTTSSFGQEENAVVRVDVNDAIRMALHPQAAPELLTEHRLLPSDAEMEDGNAAVVMLRTIYEQQGFMTGVLPKMRQLLELDYDDPRIAAEFPFDRFYRQFTRAAYFRDAQWHYPLDQAEILLPDAQVMRQFVDRGLRLHCYKLLAAGRLDEARQCVLVQLACARHLARTPILVNRLIAEAACRSAVECLEIMVRQPNCPNLYWALAMLPDSIADTQASLQWESQNFARGIPALGKSKYPSIGDPKWIEIADQFSALIEPQIKERLSTIEALALQSKLLTIAHRELEQRKRFDKATRDKMLPQELVMRWILMTHKNVHAEIEAAFSLPGPLAIKRLQQLKTKIDRLMKETGSPAVPFPNANVSLYVTLHAFDRSVKQLQVVESIRDHAARTGALPEDLSELSLPCPLDPLTGKPFEYRLTKTQAFLSPLSIPGVEELKQNRKTYRLKVASSE